MTIRLVSSLVILGALFILPWWLVFVLTIAGLFYFNLYFEGVAIFFLADLVYGLPVNSMGMIQFPLTFLAIFLLVVIHTVRDNFLVYN